MATTAAQRRKEPNATPHGTKVIFRRTHLTAKGLMKSPFQFQIPPTDSWRRQPGFDHGDYQTIGSGQYSRPSGLTLEVITFSSLFVDYDPSWSAYRYGTDNDAPPVDPAGWTAQLRRLMRSGTPFQVSIGRPEWWGEWDVRWMDVTLRTFDVEERAGEPDSRYFDVQLSEWREPSVAVRRRGLPITVTIYEKGDVARWDDGSGAEHTLKDPDMAKLAKRFYKNVHQWRAIAKANKHLRHWSAHRDLTSYVQRFGHGKKGKRTVKITIPEVVKK